jgi:hypothetical protein
MDGEIINIEDESDNIKRGFYDGYIIEQANELKRAVKKDWDGVVYVCGRERSGKTTFAQQFALLLDGDFNIDKMCWTAKQLKEKVLNAKKYDCIVLDEAYMTFAKARRFEKLNDEIISMLTMIGKKNLFIIIVAPIFWQMNEYLMTQRTCAMYRIYSKGERRGFWELYGFESKERLYYQGKNYKSFTVVPPDRRGRFGAWQIVDKEEYDLRKESVIQELNDKNNKNNKNELLDFKDIRDRRVEGALWAYYQLNQRGIIKMGGGNIMMQLLDMANNTFYSKLRNAKEYNPSTNNIPTTPTTKDIELHKNQELNITEAT